MSTFCRELHTNIQIEPFVDGVLGIEDEEARDNAVNLIAQAEKNIRDYPFQPTLTHQDNRKRQYRSEDVRKKLRKQIVDELFQQKRLDDDDKITLSNGGAQPKTQAKNQGKAFYVIGPPAAGKSGVAAKLADAYGCVILDSDFAKRKLPEFEGQVGSASLVHEESDALIFGKDGLIMRCLPEKTNIVIPKIGHKMQSVLDFCEFLKERGYEVYLVSVDLDRQKATKRAYARFCKTKRYVPLSLIFDGYGDQATLNYFRIKQRYPKTFSGFVQISTDVSIGEPVELIEAIGIEGIDKIDGIARR